MAFDRTLNPGGALGNVVNPLTGQRIVGGLVYAGQNGANEYQGDPPGIKISPRVGMVYSMNPKTVVRAGYGIYWAPWNYQAVAAQNYGNIGFTEVTQSPQPQFIPTVSLTNPFPNGVSTPFGNTRGALTGVGSADRVHRSGQDRAADSPVLDRHRPRIARQHRDRFRVRRRHRHGPEPRRLERRRDQHQPGADAVPVTRPGAPRAGAQPVLRAAGRPGQERGQRDDSAPRAAASVPAVQRHPDAPVDARRRASTTPPC